VSTVLPGTGLHRGSTGEELAALLREMIMSSRLEPDEPMREAALSERFEVSRRTVRDALGILEHEGLVRHHRHKGSRVTRLDVADIRDLYRVRRTLELAAAAACDQAGEWRWAELRAAFTRLSDATTVGRAEDIVRRDLEFHGAVVGLLDSARIDGFFAAIATEMRYALSILEASYQESRRRPRAALDEHRAIYRALLDGDRATAVELISEHIDVNEQLLARAIEAGRVGAG
jgi:DNA-binding GntR family transcriptional regulator